MECLTYCLRDGDRLYMHLWWYCFEDLWYWRVAYFTGGLETAILCIFHFHFVLLGFLLVRCFVSLGEPMQDLGFIWEGLCNVCIGEYCSGLLSDWLFVPLCAASRYLFYTDWLFYIGVCCVVCCADRYDGFEFTVMILTVMSRCCHYPLRSCGVRVVGFTLSIEAIFIVGVTDWTVWIVCLTTCGFVCDWLAFVGGYGRRAYLLVVLMLLLLILKSYLRGLVLVSRLIWSLDWRVHLDGVVSIWVLLQIHYLVGVSAYCGCTRGGIVLDDFSLDWFELRLFKFVLEYLVFGIVLIGNCVERLEIDYLRGFTLNFACYLLGCNDFVDTAVVNIYVLVFVGCGLAGCFNLPLFLLMLLNACYLKIWLVYLIVVSLGDLCGKHLYLC
eukprot:gene13170-9016_t